METSGGRRARRRFSHATYLLILGVTAWATSGGAAPGHRLDHDVIPVSEALKLTMDPGRTGYTGIATIALSVSAATDSFRFHALKLDLKTLRLRDAAGPVPLRWRTGEHGVVIAHTARALRLGRATLVVTFANDYDTHANALYKFESGGRSFLASQFEAVAAREAFPCWDEPEFKIPWDLAVETPAGNLVVANTLPLSTTRAATMKTVVFRRTPPLPSYLLNFAVGPYVSRPIPGLAFPGRVITVPGQLTRAAAAIEETPRSIAALERWFGRPYPYEKLDLIALPEFIGGAMENAAAITFDERALLLDPKTTGVAEQASMFETLTHEISHMWFGDLVTMQWWDDLWLNESFANSMSTRITCEVHPEYSADVEQRANTETAFDQDARISAHAIRAPVDADDNLDLLFDGFAYEKGEAVLGMLEDWIGADAFRDGVRDYLSAHAGGNAVAGDLWRALAARSGLDLAPVTSAFFDHAGAPIVTATRIGSGRVRLHQQRYVPIGRPSDAMLWSIPVALWGGASDAASAHVLLDSLDASVTLSGQDSPLHPNAGERGYYRWNVPEESMRALARDASRRMTPRERVGFVHNLGALLRSGQLHADAYFSLLPQFRQDPEADVILAVIGELERVDPTLVEDASRANFAAYVRGALQPAFQRIGLMPSPSEPVAITRLRPALLLMLSGPGRDDAVAAQCAPIARRVLADTGSVSPSLARAALAVAAGRGDSLMLGRLIRAYERARDPGDQRRLIGAIGNVRGTALVDRALRWSISGALKGQEMLRLQGSLRGTPENQEQVYQFFTTHYDEIAHRLPAYRVASLPAFADGASTERLERARAFFADPAHRVNGTEVELAKVDAAVTDRAALRKAELPNATRFLFNGAPR